MVLPAVQSSGTETSSRCMRRPAESSGKLSPSSMTTRSLVESLWMIFFWKSSSRDMTSSSASSDSSSVIMLATWWAGMVESVARCSSVSISRKHSGDSVLPYSVSSSSRVSLPILAISSAVSAGLRVSNACVTVSASCSSTASTMVLMFSSER